MGRSEEKEDFWGKKYTQHYDDNGNECGTSKEMEDFWGRSYTQDYDSKGNTSGTSRTREDYRDNEYIEHKDDKGDISGTSRQHETFWGNEYTQHYNSKGDEIGTTRERESFLGNRYLEHDGDTRGSSSSSASNSDNAGRSSDSYSSNVSSDEESYAEESYSTSTDSDYSGSHSNSVSSKYSPRASSSSTSSMPLSIIIVTVGLLLFFAYLIYGPSFRGKSVNQANLTPTTVLHTKPQKVVASGPIRNPINEYASFLAYVKNETTQGETSIGLFISEYVKRFRSKELGSLNEFTKAHFMESAEEKLSADVMNNVNWNRTYTQEHIVVLEPYDFINSRFDIIEKNGYRFESLESSSMHSLRSLNIVFVNANDFSELYIPHERAEQLANMLQVLSSGRRRTKLLIHYHLIPYSAMRMGIHHDRRRQLCAYIDQIEFHATISGKQHTLWRLDAQTPLESYLSVDVDRQGVVSVPLDGVWLLCSNTQQEGQQPIRAVFNWTNQDLVVQGPRWSGAGKFDGSQGHYNWVSETGQSGKASFIMDEHGWLHINGSNLFAGQGTVLAKRADGTSGSTNVDFKQYNRGNGLRGGWGTALRTNKISAQKTTSAVQKNSETFLSGQVSSPDCATENTGTYIISNVSQFDMRLIFNSGLKKEVLLLAGQEFILSNVTPGDYGCRRFISYTHPDEWLSREPMNFVVRKCMVGKYVIAN